MKKIILLLLLLVFGLNAYAATRTIRTYRPIPYRRSSNPFIRPYNTYHGRYYDRNYNRAYYNNRYYNSGYHYYPRRSGISNGLRILNRPAYRSNFYFGPRFGSRFRFRSEMASAYVPVSYNSDVKDPRVSLVEKNIYGKSFEHQEMNLRLNRLEKSMFNKTYPSMSVKERIDNLFVNYNSEIRQVSPKELSSLEKRVFKRTYENDSEADRISRLEENVLGAIQQGDMLLTVQRLVPEREYSSTGGYYSRTWDNVRGRGDKNRTHDAVVEDCSLYRANVVEYDDPVSHTRFKRLYKPNGWDLHNNPDAQPFWLEHDMETESYEFTRKDGNVEIPLNKQPDDIVLEVYDFCKRHVYVSAEKTDNWAYSSDARANVEVYPEEIINLTYMNSVWLEWVITNKQLGGWQVGGRQVNYAYAIRYLKTAMDYIRKREEEEKAILDAADPNICKDQNWPLKLSQWKLANHVRKITPYQAKRFTKYVYQ